MKPIPCFDEAFDKSKPYTVFDEGLRVVEVAAIIGSVDKCHELDDQFRPMNRSDRKELFRSEQITAAAENVEFFPPIEVYKFRDNYYVVDGHRRVRAAKERSRRKKRKRGNRNATFPSLPRSKDRNS